MTIEKIISQLDSQLPNTASQSEKVGWLDRIDRQVKHEILDTHTAPAEFEGYTDDTPLNTTLLIPEPYDECYIRYMEAQIHYAMGEMSRYKNSMMLFNTVYSAYSSWYHRTHTPVNAGGFRI